MVSPKCAVTTCPRASSKLELTIARLRAVGFDCVEVHQDYLRTLGPWGNFLRAVSKGAEYVFQDDVFVSKCLIQYVAQTVEANPKLDVLTLYCSELQHEPSRMGWHAVDYGRRAWGALGYWISSRLREGLREEFGDSTMGNGTEIQLEEFLKKTQPRYVHWQHDPSLILHTGIESSFHTREPTNGRQCKRFLINCMDFNHVLEIPGDDFLLPNTLDGFKLCS